MDLSDLDDIGQPWYNRQGDQIKFSEWHRLNTENPDYKIVKQTEIGPFWVSTVLLGIDHGMGYGRPLIFETLPFWKEPDQWSTILQRKVRESFDSMMQRYSTLAEAEIGHELVCEEVRQMWRSIQGE